MRRHSASIEAARDAVTISYEERAYIDRSGVYYREAVRAGGKSFLNRTATNLRAWG